MKDGLKNIIRSTLQWLHLDLTKNLKYDRLTKKIICHSIKPGMGCVDIGCHKGEILDLMIAANPEGRFWAFEPIPELATALEKKYGSKVDINTSALSDSAGTTKFNYVRNAPAYSGILQRTYATDKPEIELLTVVKSKLDDLIGPDQKVGFIKIDVEGGELPVLRGAERIIKENKPVILFECGLGASEHYGTRPEDVFSFFREKEMGLWLVDRFLDKSRALSSSDFIGHFNRNDEYYFVAGPLSNPRP